MPPVTMEAGWLFQALWKHHADSRCKVCIPDTILTKDGAPYRWLFTSRSGEVVRKRALEPNAIKERFVKLGLLLSDNEPRHVGVVRSRGRDTSTEGGGDAGQLRMISAQALGQFLHRELASTGDSVLCIQSYIRPIRW